MENKNYCVYCHTNKQNGKRYIGITCQKPEQRWRNGNGYKTSPHFWYAINCYGWDAFTHEIWYTDLTKEEAEVLEIELIAKYETQNPLKGYNISAGGNAPTAGKHLSKEVRKKISETQKGKKLSEETRKKMSEVHADLNIEKKINILKGQGCLPVICVETNIIYISNKIAGESCNVSSSAISRCILGYTKTAGGYHWQRVTWEEYEAQEAAKGGDANGSC